MDPSQAKTSSDPCFSWGVLVSHLKAAYENLESPSYLFSHAFFDKQKYPEVLRFLEAHYNVNEDTEPNADVSYVYFIEGVKLSAVLRVSFVGKYFYLSSLLEDGGEEEPSIESLSDSSKALLMKHMLDAGFVFTSGKVLKEKIIFAGQPTTVYSLLYSYEDEPSWL
jgi:hypothetical protein